ncbi:MAG TPA: rhodanese-like domain-containing protein, partial [Granulicella sp.]|nr:rhodanese-like domain-containing protein [Granulicella sp.]
LPKQIASVPAEKPIYVICGSGYRSSVSASVLAHPGRTQIVNVNGGVTAWKSQGPPVVKP